MTVIRPVCYANGTGPYGLPPRRLPGSRPRNQGRIHIPAEAAAATAVTSGWCGSEEVSLAAGVAQL